MLQKYLVYGYKYFFLKVGHECSYFKKQEFQILKRLVSI